jgi:hypothetical protein
MFDIEFLHIQVGRNSSIGRLSNRICPLHAVSTAVRHAALSSPVESTAIGFQIRSLGCVISRSPSTTHYLYALLREAPSILAKNII